MRRMLALAGAAGLVLVPASAALAHVTVQPQEATTGSFSRFVVRVPTERDDAATIRVEVEFPPLAFVSFQPKEGWDREVDMVEPDEPLVVFGEEVTEVVGTVTWEGGRIEPGEFEEFGFSVRTPEEETTLEFPAVQTYDSGEEVEWIGPPDAEEPAARLTVIQLPAGEDQGQLAVLADLAEQVGPEEGEETENEPAGATEAAGAPAILTYVALAVAVAALAVSLMRRRRA